MVTIRGALGLVLVLSVVASAACGSGRPPPEAARAPSSDARDTGDAVEASGTEPGDRAQPAGRFGCPPSLEEASRLPADCDEGGVPRSECRYPDGECWCGEPVQCAGAYPEPLPVQWNCQRGGAEACPDHPSSALER